MPVVGKRYKRNSLGCNYHVVVEGVLDNQQIVCSIVPDGKTNWNRFTYQPCYFWDDFKELPDSNSQKPEEMQIQEKANSEETWNLHELDEEFNAINIKKKEVNEVERALEELEEEAFQEVTIGTDNKHRYLADLYMELREKAQNLVNALEAETVVEIQENNEECVDPVSIKKETYKCAHDYVLKNQGYNSDYLIKEYKCSICGKSKATIQLY